VEVRDPIHGAVELGPGETAVIDHPLFQRLRNIKQLGFAELSFPSATHSRYGHSIGVLALSSQAFRNIFADRPLSGNDVRSRFHACLRLAALLHDVGHLPLSHAIETSMPQVEALGLRCVQPAPSGRQATHEDYTLKVICESSLSPFVAAVHPDVQPEHVAALIDPGVPDTEGFFVDDGLDYRPLLSQLVSSELDVDRVAYLLRDSYFAGVAYGRFDHGWLLAHLSGLPTEEGRVHLALDRRALYAFDDFLLSRYHMFLMVYFHYRPVVFKEMLRRFLQTEGAGAAVPSDVEALIEADDHALMVHLRRSENEWARRIVDRDPYKLLVERHGPTAHEDIAPAKDALQAAGVPHIRTDSFGVLSKYANKGRSGPRIYVLDRSAVWPEPPLPLEESTDLFRRYGDRRRICRLYVPREERAGASRLLAELQPA